MGEENNNNPNKVVEEGKKLAKQAIKDGTREARKKLITWAMPVIGWIALILLAVGCLNLIVYEIRSFFKGKTVSVNPDALSSTASVQMQDLITFNENGGYELNEDYANDLIEELESKSIDTEALRLVTPNGTNMIDRYIKTELKLMLPKTGETGDFDGLIEIERIKSDGTKIDLKYKSYNQYKEAIEKGELGLTEKEFTIVPETFKILILGGSKTTTTYKDINGNTVTGPTDGDMAQEIEEIDYQQRIQSCAVPFDFLLTLHSFSQNINFMNAVLNKIEGIKSPIVLSYIESSVTDVTTKSYAGTEKIYEKIITTYSTGKKVSGQEILINENVINDSNVKSYKESYNNSSLDLTWAEKTVTTVTGSLYITKANTWLKTFEKIVEQQSTPATQVGETSNKTITGNYSVLDQTIEDQPKGGKTEIENIHKMSVTEKSITTSSSDSNTVVDKENKIKVDDFVNLIKSYPKVRDNLESAPSNIFSLLEENESTQTLAKVMRYVLYKLTGNNYGVTEDDLKYILDDSFLDISGLTGASIEEKIWFTMLGLGYRKEAIAGVLGNFSVESAGMVANRLQFDYAKGGANEIPPGYTDETYTEAVDNGTYTNFAGDSAGYGLAQWTSGGRKKGLLKFAQSQGVSIGDEDLQIAYLLRELGHTEFASYGSKQIYDGYGFTVSDWKNALTPSEAAEAFCWIYERPQEYSSSRGTRAEAYYQKFKDLDVGGTFTKGSGTVIGTFTSLRTGKTFTIFNQMKISGWDNRCNRAAQISVCSGYYNLTPSAWIDKADLAPNLTMPRYTPIYDLGNLTYKNKSTGSTYDTDKIRTQILNGGYIIMYLKGAEAGRPGVSYTGRKWASSMHWVAILGYRLNNGKAEMFVSDSGHYNSGWVPIDEFNKDKYGEGMVDAVIYVNVKK